MNAWQIRELSTVDKLNSGRGSAIDLSPSAKTCHDLPATVTSQGLVHLSGSSPVDAVRPCAGHEWGTADTAQLALIGLDSTFPRNRPFETQPSSPTEVMQQCADYNRAPSSHQMPADTAFIRLRFWRRRLDQQAPNLDRPPAMRRTRGGLEGLDGLSPSATSSALTLKTWCAYQDQDSWIPGRRCWTSLREPG